MVLRILPVLLLTLVLSDLYLYFRLRAASDFFFRLTEGFS